MLLWAASIYMRDWYFTVGETAGHSFLYITYFVYHYRSEDDVCIKFVYVEIVVNGTVVCCKPQGQSQLVAAW